MRRKEPLIKTNLLYTFYFTMFTVERSIYRAHYLYARVTCETSQVLLTGGQVFFLGDLHYIQEVLANLKLCIQTFTQFYQQSFMPKVNVTNTRLIHNFTIVLITL